MAKTNFTKVEEALTQGLRRMEIEKLNDEAKKAKESAGNPAVPDKSSLDALHRQRIQALKLAIKWLIKQDKTVVSKVKTTEKEIKRLTETPLDQLNDFDFEIIDSLIARIDVAKKDIAAQQGTKGDEDLIAQQRRKHVTKRFNVNDKWLPLK